MTRPLRKCEMQKILIADDDPTSLLVLIGLLRKMDYEVLVANDGVEAWNMFRLHSPLLCYLGLGDARGYRSSNLSEDPHLRSLLPCVYYASDI